MRVCVCVIVCVILCCRHARAYQQFSARASRPHSLKFQVQKCGAASWQGLRKLCKKPLPNTVAREKSKTAPVTGVHGFITHVGNPRLLLRTGAESGQRQGSMLPSQRPPRRTDGFAENVSVLEVSRLDVEDFVADLVFAAKDTGTEQRQGPTHTHREAPGKALWSVLGSASPP